MNSTPQSSGKTFDANEAYITPAEMNAIFEKSNAEAEETLAASREAVRLAGLTSTRSVHRVLDQ